VGSICTANQRNLALVKTSLLQLIDFDAINAHKFFDLNLNFLSKIILIYSSILIKN